MPVSLQQRLRAMRLAAKALGGTTADLLSLIARSALTPKPQRAALALHYRRRWAGRLLRNLGVQVTMQGAPAVMPAIYMANHRSYLDPPVIMAHVPCTMLSKAEVARYPVIGRGARAVGIVFVQRESVRSRGASLDAIAQAVADGQSVALFPEGTTAAGPAPIDFKPGVFALAAARGIPIVPVALEYGSPADAWVTDHLWPHFLQAHGPRRAIRVQLRIGAPVTSADTQWLMHHTRTYITDSVLQMRQELEWPVT
jgi:1-acyl-sn-glycerol-3-phosphate acyltransferase